MEVRPVRSENSKQDLEEGDAVAIVDFDENAFSAIGVMLHVYQVCAVPHLLYITISEQKERLKAHIRNHCSDYIHGLVVVTPRQVLVKNDNDMKRLFHGPAHNHRILRRSFQGP